MSDPEAPAPQLKKGQKEDEVTRVAPLTAPIDRQDLPRRSPQAALTAAKLTLQELIAANLSRVQRWHPGKGVADWSPLEWAGAMAGEAGEACNAAKKLKRIDIGTANINHGNGRSLTDRQRACKQVAKEVADTVIYGVLVCAAVGEDLAANLIEVFNQKSEEYGFPERIGAAAAVSRLPPPACSECERLQNLLNTPEIHDFAQAVVLEALHQRERWPVGHDREKTDADWFWLIGYLAGKALHNPPHPDVDAHDKQLHRIITIAAAAANWHAARVEPAARLPPQPIEHEVRLTRERVKAAIVAAVDRMAKYHDERYIPIGDFLDDALEYALDAAVATDAVLRAEDALLAEVLTLRRAVQDSAAFINNEQVQAARLPPAPAPQLTEDNRTRWLTGHQERGHTITLRRCYDECSCGTMYWRDLPADLAHLEGTAWEPVPLPAPAPAPQLSRDATDEEAEAAGDRMIEKHRGLLEKLAAHDRRVAPAPAPQPERRSMTEPHLDDVGDLVCEHGTAMDVHCCNCHSGFIFDPAHECEHDDEQLGLYRCTVCGTRWLLWPDAIHGGGWNLLDRWQRPGACCDNVAMGDQIEHLRDIDLGAPAPAPAWQPMETAPKDAGQLLGWFPLPGNANGVNVMHWDDDQYAKKPRPHWDVYGWLWGQSTLRACQPTHWQPLPPPPEQET